MLLNSKILKFGENMENKENMKKFYDTIAEKYDFIFSLSDVQKNFFQKYVTGKKVLDVGAATGNLSKFLKNEEYDVISIDINEKLIEQAREKNVDVKKLDMMRIDELGKFDTILNVGNTLPHLNSKDEIFLFLQKAYSQLESNGKLIIQLINFYKFFENQKSESDFLGNLPLIENENVKFERYYYKNSDNNVIFKTILDDKFENEEVLTNVNYFDFMKFFEQLGISNVKVFGGFNESEFILEKSQPLIFVITKK